MGAQLSCEMFKAILPTLLACIRVDGMSEFLDPRTIQTVSRISKDTKPHEYRTAQVLSSFWIFYRAEIYNFFGLAEASVLPLPAPTAQWRILKEEKFKDVFRRHLGDSNIIIIMVRRTASQMLVFLSVCWAINFPAHFQPLLCRLDY